ncbi:hypothetical protein ACFFHM_18390 [Halalkalibacter kiskunsagensis]|uniref:Uncharacterized protein n=1 Tax=Halalkalibacter kiskunsagensis TaxID=1548599 RepID=A0ABV6KHF3_9BACI
MNDIKKFISVTLLFLLVQGIISGLIGWYIEWSWVNVAFLVAALSLLLSAAGHSSEAHLAMKTLGNHVPRNGTKLQTFTPFLLSSLLLLVICFIYAII